MAELLPLIVVLLAFWLFFLRPQRRRQMQMRATIDAATPGTEVVLTSGIFGVIKERTDDHVLVEIADGVAIRVLPGAIGQTVFKEDPADEESATADDSEATNGTTTPAMFDKPDSEEN
ncbi:preprotein translocase subunit YajC [Nocardioides sp.]|uniref:preprotein translocase subunit YajC n=1 Tax=Nocardioides sp. TaxID=35761 RepID=UPI00260D0841|nr:preprotein translocase subunit YajC [Nocardioides sp.]